MSMPDVLDTNSPNNRDIVDGDYSVDANGCITIKSGCAPNNIVAAEPGGGNVITAAGATLSIQCMGALFSIVSPSATAIQETEIADGGALAATGGLSDGPSLSSLGADEAEAAAE